MIEENALITDRGINCIRKQEQERMMGKWGTRIRELADTGRGSSAAILSSFKEWVNREHGEMTFQVTQIITGHGCFKGYTHRIGKTDNSKCSFCNAEVEDNLHVLAECREWRAEREALELVYGGRVETVGALLWGMARDPIKWRAATEFAGAIMNRKEEVERMEQAEERRRGMAEEAAERLGRTGRGFGRRTGRSSNGSILRG